MLGILKKLFSAGKKAVIMGVVFYAIIALFSYFIGQNRPRVNEKSIFVSQQKEIYKILKDKRFTDTNSGKITLAVQRSMTCVFFGELCTNNPPISDDHFNHSLMGGVAKLFSTTYTNPPASGLYWASASLQKAGFIPQSYAAEGVGFASIKPLMNLWKIFRDIAYLLIVLVLVFIGFMIMFRVKMNPQTVISVENALPKIVVSLLLITFSFPIAGVLIDAMYLVIILIINVLSSNGTYYSPIEYQNIFLQSDFITLWNHAIPLPKALTTLWGFPQLSYVGDAFAALLPQQIHTIFQGLSLGLGVGFVGKIVMQVIDFTQIKTMWDNIQVVANSLGNIVSGVTGIFSTVVILVVLYQLFWHGIGLLIGLIIDLAIFGMIFNIFFMLLRSYIQITISIILSPIILLFEAVPGKSVFGFWLKGLVGELITFPTVITLLLIEKVMFMTMSYPGDYWNPPFLFQLRTDSFGVIFGMGLLLITPDLIKFVKEGIGAKPLPFNIGLNTFLGGAGAVGGGAMGIASTFSTISMGLGGFQNLTGIGKQKAPNPGGSADDYFKAAKKYFDENDRVGAPAAGDIPPGGKK